MSDIEMPPNRGPIMDLSAARAKTPKKPVMGELCFFKRLRSGLGPDDHFVEIKGGHGFGILLGTVLDTQAVPAPQLLSALMSYHGWVTFDDVAALLGKAVCDELLIKLQTKYFNVPPEASKAIVDAAGKSHVDS